jgi:hypothetical protein
MVRIRANAWESGRGWSAVVNADAIIADVERMQPVALRGEILSLCSYACPTRSSFIPSDDAKRDARQVRHCDRPARGRLIARWPGAWGCQRGGWRHPGRTQPSRPLAWCISTDSQGRAAGELFPPSRRSRQPIGLDSNVRSYAIAVFTCSRTDSPKVSIWWPQGEEVRTKHLGSDD